jgi:hypothetical protein
MKVAILIAEAALVAAVALWVSPAMRAAHVRSFIRESTPDPSLLMASAASEIAPTERDPALQEEAAAAALEPSPEVVDSTTSASTPPKDRARATKRSRGSRGPALAGRVAQGEAASPAPEVNAAQDGSSNESRGPSCKEKMLFAPIDYAPCVADKSAPAPGAAGQGRL